ncbi:MAG TPA: RNA-binding protein [Methanomassiliicoccales archaeon]|nr:RNA-binding protein [Methanomassiliicoccales archaeon]
MSEIRVRKRRRLREKELKTLAETLLSVTGAEMLGPKDTVDVAEGPGCELILVNNVIEGMIVDGQPFPTIRGLLRHKATKRYVTVDMGAVPFVTNGADVMAPGIVEVDPEVKEGDLVWIRDMTHKRPLAIGRALVPAEVMAAKAPGKAIENLHFVGDKIWKYDER